jgi:hypothetical protein
LSFIQKYINIGDLFYDRTYLPLLKFGSPRHNFIAERHNEEESITSIVMGILNVQAMINECRTSFYPELKEQYSKMIADRNIGNKEEAS